jgi:hypothetical protein
MHVDWPLLSYTSPANNQKPQGERREEISSIQAFTILVRSGRAIGNIVRRGCARAKHHIIDPRCRH